jgi:hypothetical protein
MSDKMLTAKELLRLQRQLVDIQSEEEEIIGDEDKNDTHEGIQEAEEEFDYEQHPKLDDFGI